MKTLFQRIAALAIAGLSSFACVDHAAAQGSIFLTGHDPDFHASLGGNLAGARRFNQLAIGFVNDPGFNPYVAPAGGRFLFVESRIPVPGGHTIGKNGIIASGYVEGVNFDHADASTLNAALNGLGTTYSAIVVASDFGGILTQAELDILNARSSDIANFINTGGGIYAMAESGSAGGLTTHDRFGFIPRLVAGATLNQNESGFTVSGFGASIGYTVNEVNGNASHNIFTSFGGLSPVDFDASGNVMSVAGRDVVPSAGGLAFLAVGGVVVTRRRR